MEIIADIFKYLVILVSILTVAYACYRVDKLNDLKREPVGKRVKVMKNGVMIPGKVMQRYENGECLVITDRCGAVFSLVDDLEPIL